MPGQLVQDIKGSQRALIDRVTLVNAIKFPAIAMLPKGPTVDNILYEWPVDRFEDAEQNAVVDGKDVENFDNAAEEYDILQNRIQWFRETALVSKLSQDVQNQAGVKNKRAYAIRKKMEKLWRDIESAICSDNEAVIGTGATANKLRGMGKWIDSAAQSVYPVPSVYRTKAGAIHSATLDNLTEPAFQEMTRVIWNETGNIKTYKLLLGGILKRKFTEYTNTEKSGASYATSLRFYSQKVDTKKITHTIDRYEGDFMNVDLIPTHWNAKFTSDAANTRRGYLIDQDCLDLVWKQMPRVAPLPDLGGGPRFLIDAIAGLRVYNPLALGKISSTTGTVA